MDKKRLTALVIAVLDTVVESKGDVLGGVPEGILYAGLMGEVDLDVFQEIILGTLKKVRLVESNGHLLFATPKGEEVIQEIRAKLPK